MNNLASTLKSFLTDDDGLGTELSQEWIQNIVNELEKQEFLLNSLFQEKERLLSRIEFLENQLNGHEERRGVLGA